MTEFSPGKLLKLFFKRLPQIHNLRLDDDGNIEFDIFVSDPKTEAGDRPVSRVIERSELEDMEAFFDGPLQSRSSAQHLLKIVWIREDKFMLGPLKDDDGDMYDFIRDAFETYDIMAMEDDADCLLSELLDEGYLYETNSGYSLTEEGRHVAEGMFKVITGLISGHTESTVNGNTNKITPAVQVVNREDIKAVVTECLQQPIAVYNVPQPKPAKEMVQPVEDTDGFWLQQDKYLPKVRLKVRSLRKYREAKEGMVWSEDRTWGIDGQGNVLKKDGRSYQYFVFFTPELRHQYLLSQDLR